MMSPSERYFAKPSGVNRSICLALGYKDSLDYGQVWVDREEFPPFGQQPDNCAMTPNGEMYFNMEAQGNILADYFVLKHLNEPGESAQPIHIKDIALYEEVLSDFFKNPADRANLP